MQPYSPKTVQQAILEVLRTNEHFPDPQTVAVRCEAVEPCTKEPNLRMGQPYGDVAWMAPHIRKMIAEETDAEAEEIHAAGLLNWREAEAAGVDFAEWNRAYRARFPVGSRGV